VKKVRPATFEHSLACFRPRHVSLNHQNDVNVIHGRGAEVPNVDVVAISNPAKATSMAAEGSNGNLTFDQDGCPMPPVGLGDPEASGQPILLPILDLRTRVERGLDSVNLFDKSPGAQLRSWTAPLYPEHWDL
jgi:hypothetical protein